MPTIGTMTYPDDPMKILADRNIGPLYKSFLTKRYSWIDLTFLQGRFDPKRQYKIFLSTQARKQLNLPNELTEAVEKLADAKDFSLKSWRKPLEKIWDLLNSELKNNHNDEFFKSEVFKKAHALLVADKEAQRVAQAVGMKDTAVIKNIIRALVLKEVKAANQFIVDAQKRDAALGEQEDENEKPASILRKIIQMLRLK